MRVVPRRSKGRPESAAPARPAPPAPRPIPPPSEDTAPTAPQAAVPVIRPDAPPPYVPPRPLAEPAGPPGGPRRAPGATPAPLHPAGAVPDGSTAELPAAPYEGTAGQVPDADRRRRERAAQRRRAAVEAKRARAAQRQGRAHREPVASARAADQHRSALIVMIVTLGLLIAAVVVTGGMIAASMRTRPITLAAPLHVYPVTQTTPGQCPAGTQGITGQATTGLACYRLSQGIVIRKVSDLRVQRSRATPGGYDVAVTLRRADRKAFAALTRATVGRDLAFVVRDRLVTLPRVEMAILDGKIVVTGTSDRVAADRLVRDLRGR